MCVLENLLLNTNKNIFRAISVLLWLWRAKETFPKWMPTWFLCYRITRFSCFQWYGLLLLFSSLVAFSLPFPTKEVGTISIRSPVPELQQNLKTQMTICGIFLQYCNLSYFVLYLVNNAKACYVKCLHFSTFSYVCNSDTHKLQFKIWYTQLSRKLLIRSSCVWSVMFLNLKTRKTEIFFQQLNGTKSNI